LAWRSASLPELDKPLRRTGFPRSGFDVGKGSRRGVNRRLVRLKLLQAHFYGRFIKCIDVPCLDVQSVLWTLSETGSQAVTQFIGYEASFAVDEFQRTLRAGGDALATAVTFVFVYDDDFPLHGFTLSAKSAISFHIWNADKR
jgi:hypothetical protein